MTPRVIVRDGRTRDWLQFTEPVAVMLARTVDEVVPALRSVEARVSTDRLYAAGFVTYEAAPAFDVALVAKPPDRLPLAWFGLFHEPERIGAFAGESATAVPADGWTPGVGREEYLDAMARIKEHLRAGDSYQVNYTFRLRAPWPHDAWPLFLSLLDAQDATYGAYVDIGPFAIVSASPELLFAKEGRTVTCRPMKGTTGRGRDLKEDLARAEALRTSDKNRAENVMIVDMIRNDLGRVAEVGSVTVTDLFAVERYRTLWQMTSTVTAGTDASATEVLGALFPCASVTGAPKVRTSEIIAALETTPRRIYTGSIGVIAPDGWAQFNVAIRTALVDRAPGTAEYGIGSGIVWDSEAGDEYDECLLKARVLAARPRTFSLLETLAWTPDEGYVLFDRHLRRLSDSATYFGVPLDLEAVRERLTSAATGLGTAPAVVRLTVAPDGAVDVSTSPRVESNAPVRLALAPTPVASSDPFLFHKTTERAVYEAARAARPGSDDVVLWNERGEVTETTIANLVVRIDDAWWTPPVSSGLLAGTFRAALLDEGRVRERVIPVEVLSESGSIAVVNSVRGWRAAIIKT